jgi:hypothetical protein
MRPENPVDRRLYFRYLARETVTWFEEFRGKPNRQLSELPKLSDEAIAALIPRICPGVQIVPGDGRVSARLAGASQMVELFETNEASLLVFNHFNGESTIGQVADSLSVAMDWPRERSLGQVKELFFRLVRLRVCVPVNV